MRCWRTGRGEGRAASGDGAPACGRGAGFTGDGAIAGCSVLGGAAGTGAAAGGVALYDDILQLIRTAPPLDRRRLVALADACSGRDSGARFALTLDLLRLAVSRLALAAAGSAIDPVSEAEAALRERLGQHPEQAKIWAELEPDLLGRAERSRALNLDPGQVILDTFLRIDAAAERALLPAA